MSFWLGFAAGMLAASLMLAFVFGACILGARDDERSDYYRRQVMGPEGRG